MSVSCWTGWLSLCRWTGCRYKYLADCAGYQYQLNRLDISILLTGYPHPAEQTRY
jgi:hypothetical protein